MIDISEARLLPFQALHSFHESINVYIKVAHSAAMLLVRHAADPSNKDQLADLIATSHPSWNSPPVRDLSIQLQKQQDSSISAFAILAIFSAFDDFIVGVEAELSGGGVTPILSTKTLCADRVPDESGEEASDRIFRLYASFGWSTDKISGLKILLRYFRLCRNCIAHRNSRASKALSELSKSNGFEEALEEFQEQSERGLKAFSPNEKIHVSPTIAIMCSHVLRLLAIDVNRLAVASLGVDGILRLAARHAVRQNDELGGKPRSRPEAIINTFLFKSKIRVESRHDSIREMRRIGVWDEYSKGISRGCYVA